MAEIEYFSEKRAILKGNNKLWNVQECLEYSMRRAHPDRHNACMVILTEFTPFTDSVTYDRFICNMGYMQQSALLDAVRYNMMKEAYP